MSNVKIIFSKIALLASALLAACGGGGVPGLPLFDPDTVLKGYVVDGPLVGAKVCLDTNSNWICDVGEPSTITSAQGAFSLSIAPLKYQDAHNKQVIAEVGPDSLDEATGLTLNAAGQGGYVLASWGGPKPILSPINTLITLQQLKSSYSQDFDTVSIADLLEQSGLSSTSENYFDDAAPLTTEQRSLAKLTGRILAGLLSSARSKLKTSAATVYSADSSGLGARSAELTLSALRSTRPVNGETEAAQSQRMQMQLASIAVTESTEALTRRPLSALAPDVALALLRQGLVDVNALGSSPRAFQQYKLAAVKDALGTVRFRYIGGQWGKDGNYAGEGANGYHLIYQNENAEQVADFKKISIASPSVLVTGSLIQEEFADAVNIQANEITLLARSVSGLDFSAMPELSSFEGAFSQGQSIYLLRRTALTNQYLFDSVVMSPVVV